MKECNRCFTSYSKDQFPVKKNKRNFTDDRSPTCKSCIKAERHRHSNDIGKQSRTIDLLRDYGITIEEYEQKLKKQKGRCAICKSTEPKGRGNGVYHIDHNHTTGNIRGILCVDCNTGLGMFKESIRIIIGALRYTIKHIFK